MGQRRTKSLFWWNCPQEPLWRIRAQLIWSRRLLRVHSRISGLDIVKRQPSIAKTTFEVGYIGALAFRDIVMTVEQIPVRASKSVQGEGEREQGQLDETSEHDSDDVGVR